MNLIPIGGDRWINAELVMALPITEQARLRRQAAAMRIYSEVLDERIQAFGSVLEIKP